jgi:hypothetical protein
VKPVPSTVHQQFKAKEVPFMVNIHVRYIVYNHSGSGVRHHHYSSTTSIIKEFTDDVIEDPEGNTSYTVDGADKQYFNGDDLPFAFMSVHGCATGNLLFTSPGLQQIPVGTTDIDVLVVYAPVGGISVNGGPGVWIDAFNVDAGGFSDSLEFITVLTPPTPPDTIDVAKSNTANMEGEISTATAENMRANTHVDGVPFVKWKKIIPVPSEQTAVDVSLALNETGEIWFAFYQTKNSTGPFGSLNHIGALMEEGIFVWTGDDYCGNGGHWIPHHGPGPAPFRISLPKAIVSRLQPADKKKLDTLAKEYPSIAKEAVGAMAKVMGVLKTLGQIVDRAKK